MLLAFCKYIPMKLAKAASKDPFKPAFLIFKKTAFVTFWCAMWHFHEYHVLPDSQLATGCWTLCSPIQRQEVYVELEAFVMGLLTLHATRSPKCFHMIPNPHTSSICHLDNRLASLNKTYPTLLENQQIYHHGRFALLFHRRMMIAQDSPIHYNHVIKEWTTWPVTTSI